MKCKRCNRTLTSAVSIAREMGARCAFLDKLDRLKAALPDFSQYVIDKAAALIDEGAILPSVKRRGFFTAVSSDGSHTYLVHPNGCNCPAGVKTRPCYHRCAAITLTIFA